MARKFKKLNNKKVIKTLKTILLCVLALGIVGAVYSAFNRKDKDDSKVYHGLYEIGSLDINGEFVDSKSSIYTTNLIEFTELKITPDFDSNVSYKVYIYNADNELLSVSDSQIKKWESERYPDVMYARVVITPNWDSTLKEEDKVIKFYEVYKYSKQLTINVVNSPVEILDAVIAFDRLSGTEFNVQYEKGMTWEEWVNSDYNTITFQASSMNCTLVYKESTGLIEVDGYSPLATIYTDSIKTTKLNGSDLFGSCTLYSA